ncbi:MAG TPA: hypothetical protein PLN05_17570 [Pyrinomonadaceae bacterium]|nr:hypothetical protein [Chloracidobacterium sp.]HRK52231.1 hypothetical protein [Pyrinomonadaceae bacterium]
MRLISISFLFSILWGCSSGESARLIEQGQAHDVVGNSSPANTAVNAPTPGVVKGDEKALVIKGGGQTCEEYLLKKIAKEKAGVGRTVKLKDFNTDDETLPPELKEWLQTSIHMEMLATFELRTKKKEALILRANIARATGIAANFANWFIQLDNRSINFRSLSKNPELIFWDKDGLLNYYSVDYGSIFLENRDWDNVTLDLQRFTIDAEGKSQLISEEQNVKCK